MTSCRECVGVLPVRSSLLEFDLTFHFFLQCHQVYLLVVVLRDDRVAFYVSRTFHYPVCHILMLKPAFVADKFMDFAVFVFPACDAQDFLSFRPQHYLSAALVAFTVCVQGPGGQHAALEPECPVGERPYWAYVNHVSGAVVVDGLLHIGADPRPV